MLDFNISHILAVIAIVAVLLWWRIVETREGMRREQKEDERFEKLISQIISQISTSANEIRSQVKESFSELTYELTNSTSGISVSRTEDVTWHLGNLQKTLDSIDQSIDNLKASVRDISLNLPTS